MRRGAFFRVRALSPAQARSALVKQTFLPMWDPETAAAQMKNLFRLADSGRVLRVFGPPSAENARRLQAALEAGLEEKEEQDLKAKPGFVLRRVAEEYMLMPTGENIAAFQGAVLLNSVSAFVLEQLQFPLSREELLCAVLAEFDTDRETAERDLDALIEKLKKMDVLEGE